MERPTTRYATRGELAIAYQVFGQGTLDIALDVWWFSQVDAQWDVPPLARLLRRFGSFSRVIVGSEIRFADRGQQQLKGVPGEWRLFAVADA